MRLVPRTLRNRLLLAVLAVQLAAFGLLLLGTLHLFGGAAREFESNRLSDVANLVATAVARPMFTRDLAVLHTMLNGLVSPDGLRLIEVRNESGQPVITVHVPGWEPPPMGAAEGEIVRPVMLGGRAVGAVRLIASRNLTERAEHRATAQGLLLAGAAIAASLLLLGIIARILTLNLSALSATAEKAAAGDLSVRANVRGHDEVALAALELNCMLANVQSSEERYRNLVEGSLQGVLVLGPRWNIIFANQAAAHIYGFPDPESLMALESAEGLVMPEDRARLREYNEARLSGKPRPMRYEHLGQRRDGRPIWLDTFVRVVEWNGVPAVQSTLVDITEEKHAREALKRSEENFRRLMEDMAISTLIFDANWRPLFVNAAAARQFGYSSPAEMREAVASGAQLVAAEDREMLARYRTERLAGGTVPSRYEFRAVHRDGHTMWMQNMTSIVQWEGRPASLSISLDITEHKLREDQLRQASKMEAVGQLTGGVAHDFNNLLTIILGNLELLRQQIGPADALMRLANSAMHAADRGGKLVQRLLSFSRRQSLRPQALDASRLVSDMTELLRRTLGEHVAVQVHLGERLWLAHVDRNQLENALLNLVINARDAMPEGGQLTIATENARLDAEYAARHQDVRPGDYVLLSVSDTGQGMTPEVQARAFEPFFTTKEAGRGSGLGLSMIYGFVKQSHGHVKICSEVGRGTTVELYLPRARSDSQADAAPEGTAELIGQGEHVLVVEDEPAVGELASAMLRSLGYVPLHVLDAPSALDALRAHTDICLLFTDLVLGGGMNGMELAAAARRQCPHLKVLYTSGYAEAGAMQADPGNGGAPLVPKPYRVETLARHVRQALDARS